MMVDADEVSWADRGGRRDAAADRPGRRGPVAWATAEGIAVRLIGGVAIYLRSSCRTRSMLGRSYGDFDLVAKRRESCQLHCLLEAHDYILETVFNATHGEGRCSTATRVARTTSTVPIRRISVPLFSEGSGEGARACRLFDLVDELPWRSQPGCEAHRVARARQVDGLLLALQVETHEGTMGALRSVDTPVVPLPIWHLEATW